MPLTLEPAQVETLTGQTVTEAQIVSAADLIDALTGRTVDGFVTSGIPESSVSTAWAIVSVRTRDRVMGDGESLVTSESERDYSYSQDVARAKQFDADLLHGIPRTLLRLGVGRWTVPNRGRRDVLSSWWDDPCGFVQSRTVHHIV